MTQTVMRNVPRQATERPGWVITDDGKTEPCIVSNISSAGAKVTLTTAVTSLSTVAVS